MSSRQEWRGSGRAAAPTLLAERGEQVRIVSRRGSGPEHPAIERVAADPADADRLSSLTAGAAALYNCANPPYHRWLSDWPRFASALLAASERTDALLATASNLYGYGRGADVQCTSWPSMTVVNCGNSFSCASWARQSQPARQ